MKKKVKIHLSAYIHFVYREPGSNFSVQIVKLQCKKSQSQTSVTCEKNVKIKLTPKNILLIIFNIVYIEVNETRKKWV
jgi:archaellum component FlaF (FlaF/FlaG flagellin family)